MWHLERKELVNEFGEFSPTARYLFTESGNDGSPLQYGVLSLRSWNIRLFDRLVSEMHRLDSQSNRLVFQIDRLVSVPERPTTRSMEGMPFVYTGEVKPRYWGECQSQQGRTAFQAESWHCRYGTHPP